MMQADISWKMILFSTSFRFTFVLHLVSSLVLINKRKKEVSREVKQDLTASYRFLLAALVRQRHCCDVISEGFLCALSYLRTTMYCSTRFRRGDQSLALLVTCALFQIAFSLTMTKRSSSEQTSTSSGFRC